MALDPETADAVSAAGELLIRAAATLGRLNGAQLAAVAEASGGDLPSTVLEALGAAAKLSPSVAESLKRHPPAGLSL